MHNNNNHRVGVGNNENHFIKDIPANVQGIMRARDSIGAGVVVWGTMKQDQQWSASGSMLWSKMMDELGSIHQKQYNMEPITTGLVSENGAKCISYECPQIVCKNSYFITCTKKQVYRHKCVCKISSNSGSFFPPHLLTATRVCVWNWV